MEKVHLRMGRGTERGSKAKKVTPEKPAWIESQLVIIQNKHAGLVLKKRILFSFYIAFTMVISSPGTASYELN